MRMSGAWQFSYVAAAQSYAKVFYIPQPNWVSTIQKHPSEGARHVPFMNSYTNEIDISELFA